MRTGLSEDAVMQGRITEVSYSLGQTVGVRDVTVKGIFAHPEVGAELEWIDGGERWLVRVEEITELRPDIYRWTVRGTAYLVERPDV